MLLSLSQHFLCAVTVSQSRRAFAEEGRETQGESPEHRWDRDIERHLCVPVPADSAGISLPCNHCFSISSEQQHKLTSWQKICMNACACAAALGMDSNRLKYSKLMTWMLSVFSRTTYRAGAPAVSAAHLEEHPQVPVALGFTAHTQPAGTAGGCQSSGSLPAMLGKSVGGKPHKEISRVPASTREGAYRLWKRCSKWP